MGSILRMWQPSTCDLKKSAAERVLNFFSSSAPAQERLGSSAHRLGAELLTTLDQTLTRPSAAGFRSLSDTRYAMN